MKSKENIGNIIPGKRSITSSSLTYENIYGLIIFHLLANSTNTNGRSFQVKINCSKFIIDGLQQRCNMTLLVSLLETYYLMYFRQEKFLQFYKK